MASSPNNSGYHCGLDLLNGQQIYYASHSEVKQIGNRLAFTEKCALAVLLTVDNVDALSFPVVKNSGQLWDFAEDHSVLLRRIVLQLASEWKKFRSPTDGLWCYNLRGYVWFSDKPDKLHSIS